MSTIKNTTLESEEKVRDEEVLRGSKTSTNWSTHHMNDRTEDNNAALEPVPAGSSQDGDLLESFVVEDRDGVGQEGRRPMSATRRVCRQLCRRNMMTFTLASAFAFLTQVTVAVFMMTQITSLEREFGFTSFHTGRLLAANEIGYLCFVLPSGYLASRLHVPRAMTVASFLTGLAGLLIGLPHFLFPSSPPDHLNHSLVSADTIPPALCVAREDVDGEERCRAVSALLGNSSLTSDPTGRDVAYSQRAYPVFVYILVFQVLRGAMGASRFPMFSEYIESNTDKNTDTGFYMGVLSSIVMLGPAVAFLGGGAISRLHVSLQPTDLTPTHPEWVGAWWLGFILFGSMAALTPVFLWCFPRRLASHPPAHTGLDHSHARNDRGHGHAHNDRGHNHARNATRSHKRTTVSRRSRCKALVCEGVGEVEGFAVSVLRLLLNPVFMLLVLASCLSGFSMNGTYLFLPKYLQHQFDIPAWKANFIMGGAELTMGTSGFLLGGILTRRLKLPTAGLYKLLLAVTTLCVLLVVVLMFIGCPQPRLLGSPGVTGSSNSNCTSSCACPEEVFPVCDREANVNYFSPCDAGCSALNDGVYVNCSCTATGRAYPGQCTPDCSSVYYFSAVFYILLFLLSLQGPMHYLIVVRSVAKHHTGLAIGVSGFSTGLVAFLIGPMVFGNLIDTFCEHWKTPCGVRGQCSVYNNDRFRVEMHLYSITAMGMAVVAFFLSFLIFRCFGRHRQDDDEARENRTTTREDRMTKGAEARIADEAEKKLLQEESDVVGTCADDVVADGVAAEGVGIVEECEKKLLEDHGTVIDDRELPTADVDEIPQIVKAEGGITKELEEKQPQDEAVVNSDCDAVTADIDENPQTFEAEGIELTEDVEEKLLQDKATAAGGFQGTIADVDAAPQMAETREAEITEESDEKLLRDDDVEKRHRDKMAANEDEILQIAESVEVGLTEELEENHLQEDSAALGSPSGTASDSSAAAEQAMAGSTGTRSESGTEEKSPEHAASGSGDRTELKDEAKAVSRAAESPNENEAETAVRIPR